MAEYPEINLQSQLIGAGLNPNNPTGTYVDFATQIANARQQQAQMEQNIARAKELTAQSKIETSQKAAANEAGYNPELINTMTPKEAEAYLKIILKEKGLDVDQKTIDEWVATLPPVINRQTVEAFASRFARETNRIGSPFVASDVDAKSTKKDENGEPLVEGQMYAALYDNQGNIQSYVRSGQEKADVSLKTAENKSQFNQREWNKFIKQMNPYTASGRNSVGVAMQSYIRAVRALKALKQDVVSAEVAANIIAEIGAIYKGGSPDQAMMEMTTYRTLEGDINAKLQALTGKARKGIPDDIKNYIVKQITELNDTSKMVVKNSLDLAEQGNENTIEPYRDQWDAYKEKLNDQLENPTKDIAPGVEKIKEPEVPTKAPGAVTTKVVPPYQILEK
jgi:hypothetical protein